MTDNGLTHPDFQVIHLSAASHYALEGMVELARRPGPRMVLAEEVARRRGLPASFLAKIFRKLAAHGLLQARRGPGGGYRLSREARAIPILEIVNAVSEPARPNRTCLLGAGHCGDRPCPAHESVLRCENLLRARLNRLSLAQLAAGAAA